VECDVDFENACHPLVKGVLHTRTAHARVADLASTTRQELAMIVHQQVQAMRGDGSNVGAKPNGAAPEQHGSDAVEIVEQALVAEAVEAGNFDADVAAKKSLIHQLVIDGGDTHNASLDQQQQLQDLRGGLSTLIANRHEALQYQQSLLGNAVEKLDAAFDAASAKPAANNCAPTPAVAVGDKISFTSDINRVVIGDYGTSSSVTLAISGSCAVVQKIVEKHGSTFVEAKVVGCDRVVTCLAARVQLAIAEATAAMPGVAAEATAAMSGVAGEAIAAVSDVAAEATAVVPGVAAEATAVMPGVAAEETAVMPGVADEETAVMPGVADEATAVMPGVAAEATAVMPGVSAEETAVMPGVAD
jgi:hypothetical protein